MRTKSDKQLIHVVTLGCSKNLVDSEKLLKQFTENNVTVAHNNNSAKAHTVIINTCGFIGDAKEESVETILRYVKAKKQGIIQKLYVMGCLSERYKSELKNEIPEVDRYFGADNIAEIVKAAGCTYRKKLIGERYLTTPSHYAYLKISEGCDRRCSFCAIPLIRGKHRSVPVEELAAEAENLTSQGVKELMLIAQDLSYYGLDLHRQPMLEKLLLRLVEIDALEWIRLHYAYPAGFPLKVLKIMNNQDKICRYLDIPFQHISNRVLKNMRRGVTQQQIMDLIEHIRKTVPGITLRTTLMVGHPGEGVREFNELKNFVEHVQFERLGVFTYSEEEGTYGARHFRDSLSKKTKQERYEQIMKLQMGISGKLNREKVGKKMKVIIDRKVSGYYAGRTEGDSPDVDNEVLVRSARKLQPGKFYEATITNAGDYDLEAVV